MKTGRMMKRAAGVVAIVCSMAIAFALQADTVDHFFEILSGFEDAATQNLISAMFLLDDETDDVSGDVAALRTQFMEDPRAYLLGQGVDLPVSRYWVTAFDFGALRDLPNVFHESPLADGVSAAPYTIGWISHNAAILLQLAAPPEDFVAGRKYAQAAADASLSQEILRSVVGTPDALLSGMLRILVQVTTDDSLREECAAMGIRQFAANQDLRFESDRYALQFLNLDPVDGPQPEMGVHFTISEGDGPKVPELVGIVFIEGGASFGLAISETF